MKTALTTIIQDWLDAHPIIQWVFVHPLYAIGLGLLAVFLEGLLRAIAHFTEQVWVWLLRLPFQLMRGLFSAITFAFRPRGAAPAMASDPDPQGTSVPAPAPQSASQTRLDEILTRLDTLRQEQDDLLQEVKTILSMEKNLSHPPSPNPALHNENMKSG